MKSALIITVCVIGLVALFLFVVYFFFLRADLYSRGDPDFHVEHLREMARPILLRT